MNTAPLQTTPVQTATMSFFSVRITARFQPRRLIVAGRRRLQTLLGTPVP